MKRRTICILLASSLPLACAREDPSRDEVEAPADTSQVAEAIPYWSDEPLLTQEDIEKGRYDESWREAASINSFPQAGAAGRTVPSETIVLSDSIAIPETWDDIEGLGVATVADTAAVHLPLGGQVAGPSVLYVQVLLDRARFSPGVIDGRWGQNVEKAVYWFQRDAGLPATGIVDSVTFRRLTELAGTPSRYVVPVVLTEDDVEGPFVEIPEGVYEQAELQCLCYESLAEKLAEEFHATAELLERLNPDATLDSLAVGDTLIVPGLGELAARDAVEEIARLIVSDQGEYVHALDADGRIVYHFPSTLGSSYDPSPEGELTIVGVAMQPSFHYQPDLLSGVADSASPAMLPPGPNNPVGLVWMQLSEEHYGIHGTREPATIGYETSSGCIRLTNWDAVFLAERIDPGVPVEFTDAALR